MFLNIKAFSSRNTKYKYENEHSMASLKCFLKGHEANIRGGMIAQKYVSGCKKTCHSCHELNRV